MFYKLRLYGDPILNNKTNNIENFTNLTELIQSMFKIMYKYNGVGLAANQIGVNKKIFVYNYNNESNYLINPELIAESSETESKNEGCLSIPSLSCNVKRTKNITIKAYDINNNEYYKDVSGYLAKIYLHELDHLNGRLYLDRLSYKDKFNLIYNYKKNLIKDNQ